MPRASAGTRNSVGRRAAPALLFGRRMKKIAGIGIVGLLVLSSSAQAADYVCKGERVEKGGSTQYVVKSSGSDYTVEKGGSTKGKSIKRGSKYYVEIGGSTQATIEGNRIEKGGSSWATVDDAQRKYDCPDVVAATLWVLDQKGAL